MPVPIAAEVNRRLMTREDTHPGLALDKYVASWRPDAPPGKFSGDVQKDAVNRVADLASAPPAGLDWADLFARQRAFLTAAGVPDGFTWEMDTATPLAPHLSRASALENAGLCLHRVYGFAFLPGSGLKGMARAYAEQVWLPAQPDADEALQLIRRVFGHLKEKGDDTGRAGAVVFHDAWPTRWPRLVPDLLNSHHSSYYQGKRNEAPGDWDEPIMVSFLTVAVGQRFRFALAPRRGDQPPELIERAAEWLKAALVEEGAGAKTAAGYGGFKMVGGTTPAAVASKNRSRFSTTLELTTPAFLAGPKQDPSGADCDLRSPTLRGQLRWWWRTAHSGFVDVPTLRKLEAAVWGNTGLGGAVRTAVVALGPVAPVPFDKEATKRQHKLAPPDDNKTTQGIVYASYGMDEKKGRRCYLAPGTKWTATFTARPAYFDGAVRLDPELVLGQAKAALALLCRFGGVGSKSRNGFGSFADPAGPFALDDVKAAAKAFRAACGVDGPFLAPRAESLSLTELLAPPGGTTPWLDVPTPWKNEWYALDQVGAAMQAFAQTLAHNPVKLALGLPRQIHGPRAQALPHQHGGHKPPQQLSANVGKGRRHASPIHYHLTKTPTGTFAVRVTAMVARRLPDEPTSRKVLTDLMAFLSAELPRRAAAGGGTAAAATPVVRTVAVHGLPQTGKRVEAVLLAEKTKKGGWRASWSGPVELVGPVVNSADVPADKKVGDAVSLVVAAVNASSKEIQFRWPK